VATLQAIVRELVKPDVLIGLGVFSVFAFLVTALLVPIALARMPADYFTRDEHEKHKNPVLLVLRNLLGVMLILLGIAMLVLPGQGVLTVLLGLGLVDFPGKRRVQLRVISTPSVLKTVNALRRRFEREPLEIPRPE
jgi:uncharacterized BrkB/YihY/UPF0761 family membrane protein